MNAKRIVLIVVAAVVALSAVGVASAQAGGQNGQGQPEGPGRQGQQGEQRNPGGPGFLHRQPRPLMNGLREVVEIIRDTTGLTNAELAAQLAEGKTLTEVITESGGSADDVKAQVLSRVSERLATAVENERITQERADELLVTAGERLDELLNRVFERLADREFPGGRRGPQAPNEI